MSVTMRSRARMLALQALCVLDAVGDDFRPQIDAFLRDAQTHTDLGWDAAPTPEILSFARELALGAWEHHGRYDELLVRSVARWSLERMPPVDRAILRLGLYELLDCPQTPAAVAINEAIELARRFSAGESPAFINGVLDAIRRSQAPPKAAGGSDSQDEGPGHKTESSDGTV